MMEFEAHSETKQNTIEMVGEKYDWSKVNLLSKSIVFLVIALAILYFLPFIAVLMFAVILFGISERLFGGGKSIIKESDTKNE